MTNMLRRVVWPMVLVVGVCAQQRTVHSPAPRQNFQIKGTVVNGLTGQLLPNTEVSIGFSQKQETVQSVVTSEDGRFMFKGLASRKYWLIASRRGFLRQGYEEHEGYFTGIVVGPNFPADDLVFRLRPDASVSGVITDEENEPVRGAQVLLFHSGLENGRRMTSLQEQVATNDEGRYRFSHLAPGTYFVAVSARPWYAQNEPRVTGDVVENGSTGTLISAGEPSIAEETPRPEENDSVLNVAYPVTYYSGGTDADGADAVVLKAGDHASADVSLKPVPAVCLRIHESSVDPSQGSISTNLVQHVFGAAQVNPPEESIQIHAGEVEIRGLPPGKFEVDLRSAGKNPGRWTGTLDLSNDVEINATESPSPGVISGVVRLEGASELPRQAFIQLRDHVSGVTIGSRVSAKGEFEFQANEVKTGTYEVSVFNATGAVVSSIAATGAKVTGHSVEINSAAPVKLTVLMSRALAHVEGIALKDGKPLSGAMIVLVPQDPEHNTTLFRRDQSDSDGTFSLRFVPPGSYTVLAIEGGWDLEWSNPDVLKPFARNGENILISTGRQYDVRVNAQGAR